MDQRSGKDADPTRKEAKQQDLAKVQILKGRVVGRINDIRYHIYLAKLGYKSGKINLKTALLRLRLRHGLSNYYAVLLY